MGAAKGNKNGRGKKGRSGRKSAYQEKLDAELLVRLVMQRFSKADLRSAVTDEKKQMNMIERMVIAAHLGKERTAIAIFNKLFPDNIKLDDSEIIHRFILD